jgi:membrane protein
VSWLILLVGAEISFYHQYPQFLTVKKESLLLSNRLKERLAILVMFLIGDNFYRNRQPWTLNSLVDRLNLPLEPVQDVLSALQSHGYILETNDDPPAFLPARDLETIHLRELLNSVRVAEENSSAIEERFLSLTEVDGVMNRVDKAVGSALGKDTLKELVQSSGERVNEGSP